MPCVIGSDAEFLKLEDSRKSVNVPVTTLQEDLYPEIKEMKISQRLIITGCSGVYFCL